MNPDFLWLYEIPTWNLALLSIGVFVGFYWLGTIFLRPILRQFVKHTAGSNDIVGYVLSCFCVFYGLLLGLIAVTAYQNVAAAGANVRFPRCSTAASAAKTCATSAAPTPAASKPLSSSA